MTRVLGMKHRLGVARSRLSQQTRGVRTASHLKSRVRDHRTVRQTHGQFEASPTSFMRA